MNETKIKCLIKLLFVNWLQFEGAFTRKENAEEKIKKKTKQTHTIHWKYKIKRGKQRLYY